MYNEKNPIVITTINNITKGIEKFRKLDSWSVLLVGDRKSPSAENFDVDNLKFLSIDDQKGLEFKLEKSLPENHYCRKNLGYLYAISNGADLLGETDDDNIPYNTWFNIDEIEKTVKRLKLTSNKSVFNIYKLFSNDFIWPRGFPLNELHEEYKYKLESINFDEIAIIQGLADLNPDVDAIFRLIYKNKVTKFSQEEKPFALDKFLYCPFNSQNTIWKKESFVYLYLPVFVSFRFTDILRSYIAQRGIWALNKNICFTKPTVYQERNIHDLMKDFEDEVPVYLNTGEVIKILDSCDLTGDPFADIYEMYKNLNINNIVVDDELNSLSAWLKDLEGML